MAVTIFDGTVKFCDEFLTELKFKRTVEQMVQAARSGKQNIVEGSLEKSVEMNIKLTGVARASFGELLEDYRDFLRQRNLSIWEKNDPRSLRIRAYRESVSNLTNLTNLANWSNLNLSDAADWANLMICLLFKENYLLDQLLRSLEEKFIREGGFPHKATALGFHFYSQTPRVVSRRGKRENLFRKRMDFKRENG